MKTYAAAGRFEIKGLSYYYKTMTACITAIKTRTICPPRDDFYPVLETALPKLQEGDIIAITSKVVAISQGRCLPISSIPKEDIIKAEADQLIPAASSKYEVALAIKNNILAPSAGVDESNSDNFYTLWPESPELWAEDCCKKLKIKFNLKNLAVIITDSHCIPMRWGLVGISLGFYGLSPLRDYRGKSDLFGRKLEFSQANIADSISAAAVNIMGEGSESTPAALIRNWPGINFTDQPTFQGFTISPEEDIYEPLLRAFKNQP